MLWCIAAALVAGYVFCLPKDLFRGTSYSTVVKDRNGELLGARIAEDGQWRFPPCNSVPEKYATALIEFEDRYFKWHPGVNPVSVARAAVSNVRARRVTGGGSTITMQVIRMSRNKPRTLWQKMIEAVLATRLEIRCSKSKILALYASHAPFGGNVVGIDAAAWRYFGRPSTELSWGEAATLAVLPNSPSAMHPGRNRELLRLKRDRLLARLRDAGKIDGTEYALAIAEPLPDAPHPLPQVAPHLVDRYAVARPGEVVPTTVDIHLQRQVSALADSWQRDLAAGGVNDLAVLVVDVRTGDALAYVGNAGWSVRGGDPRPEVKDDDEGKRPGAEVDIVRAPRSTGSVLKPVLYCALLQEGAILPETLLPDVPVNINGFAPQNFDHSFSGAVPASEALTRSLNVPAVHMLRRYGVAKLHSLLKEAGMTTLTRSASDYGLSLILGGAEGTLEDITGMYASMARVLLTGENGFVLNDRASLWCTFEAMRALGRPDEIDLRMVRSVRKVAWKTGTSYGFRDAWAVGVTPDYAVGVWAGNAEGQGVPGLTGAKTAGPVMLDVFNLLPDSGAWFEQPVGDEMTFAKVCTRSGHLAGVYCDETEVVALPPAAMRSEVCPYHKLAGGQVAFVLPPAMEWYYRPGHPEYKTVRDERLERMEFIYPEGGSVLTLPKQADGSAGSVVFNLAHRDPAKVVYWHMDGSFLDETRFVHQMRLAPEVGKHVLTVVDGDGESLSLSFEISNFAIP